MSREATYTNPITMTQPYLLHLAGWWGEPRAKAYHPMGYAYYESQASRLSVRNTAAPLPRLALVTFSNYPTETLFERSANSWGYQVRVIGRQVRNFGFWQKWNYLFKEVLPFIDEEYVLYCDSKDVMLTRPLDGLLVDFEKAYAGVRMLFNAGVGYWPEKSPVEFARLEERLYSQTPWRYLNAGICLARTDYLRSIVPEALAFKCARAAGSSLWRRFRYRYFKGLDVDYDDQEAFHCLHAKYPGIISIDHQCRLFQVTGRLRADGSIIPFGCE